ncbi:hypothetical protein [Methylobacterium sp. CM6257]|jgi:pyruvate dehydrogenase E2 component (dihydrolipoamide acetyltransferase)
MLSRLLLITAVLVAASEPVPSSAQDGPAPRPEGMALTPPWTGMALTSAPARAVAALPPAVAAQPVAHRVDGLPRRQPRRLLGGAFRSLDGQLPNQRTGPMHQHVVHDICIGC